jgi:hypothetical protein
MKQNFEKTKEEGGREKKKEKKIHANPEIQQLKPGFGTNLPLSDPNPFRSKPLPIHTPSIPPPGTVPKVDTHYRSSHCRNNIASPMIVLSFTRLSSKHTRSP